MFKLEDIRKELPFHIHKGITFIMHISEITTERDPYIIDLDVYLPTKGMNLQRPLVWRLQQKQALILSIIKGIKIPSVAAVCRKDNPTDSRTFGIIDGKQRMSTWMDFCAGKFPMEWEGKDYFIDDLDTKVKGVVSRCPFVFDVVYEHPEYEPFPDEYKIMWFEQINFLGTPQDEEHLKALKK